MSLLFQSSFFVVVLLPLLLASTTPSITTTTTTTTTAKPKTTDSSPLMKALSASKGESSSTTQRPLTTISEKRGSPSEQYWIMNRDSMKPSSSEAHPESGGLPLLLRHNPSVGHQAHQLNQEESPPSVLSPIPHVSSLHHPNDYSISSLSNEKPGYGRQEDRGPFQSAAHYEDDDAYQHEKYPEPDPIAFLKKSRYRPSYRNHNDGHERDHAEYPGHAGYEGHQEHGYESPHEHGYGGPHEHGYQGPHQHGHQGYGQPHKNPLEEIFKLIPFQKLGGGFKHEPGHKKPYHEPEYKKYIWQPEPHTYERMYGGYGDEGMSQGNGRHKRPKMYQEEHPYERHDKYQPEHEEEEEYPRRKKKKNFGIPDLHDIKQLVSKTDDFLPNVQDVIPKGLLSGDSYKRRAA